MASHLSLRASGSYRLTIRAGPYADGLAAYDTANVDLGCRLRRAAWGRGYATEGSRALIGLGFTGLGVQRVFAHADRQRRLPARHGEMRPDAGAHHRPVRRPVRRRHPGRRARRSRVRPNQSRLAGTHRRRCRPHRSPVRSVNGDRDHGHGDGSDQHALAVPDTFVQRVPGSGAGRAGRSRLIWVAALSLPWRTG